MPFSCPPSSFNPAAVAITGGTATGLTSLGLRSTGAAFDLTLASAEVLTAGRTLTFNVANGNRTLTIPATGTAALLGTAQTFTATQTFDTAVIQNANVFNVLAAGFVGFNGSSLISAPSNGAFKFQNSSAANDFTLIGKASNVMQMGLDAAGVSNQMFTAANRITSDGVGANLTIAAGNGRGAAGGSLIFSYFTTAGAATIGTLTEAMRITTTGAIILASLPTSDPGVSGQLYKSAGVVMQSA